MNEAFVCLCCPGHFQLHESRATGPYPGMMGRICQIKHQEAMARIAGKPEFAMMFAPLNLRENMQN
jgi:hypothetical protein